MSTESLNCPNCGAPLIDSSGKTTVVCDHCGSVIALRRPEAPPAAQAPAAPDPRYEYGETPGQRPARSDLASITLGPADASHVIQLLRNQQELDAVQYYQSKVGGSLGEARDAIAAIQAGLRDASAPMFQRAAPTGNPADLPEVRRLVDAGDTIGAIKAYRYATGQGLREAKTAVEGLERQLYPDRMRGPVQISGQPRSRAGSGLGGCAGGCLSIVALIMCIFGGCGAYVQTKSIYRCSMREIKAALAKQEVFAPPINGGYLVFAPGFKEQGDLNRSYLNAEYYAPVWGSNGFGIVAAHIAADETGWNNVSATLYKDGQTRRLLPAQQIACGK